MQIFAFAGLAWSGKDEACRYIMSKTKAKRFSYADAIKSQWSEYFGLDPNILNDRETKEKYRRDLICWWASARLVDERVWSKNMFRQMEDSNAEIAVISDLRFEDEVDTIIEYANKNHHELHIVYVDRRQVVQSSGDKTEMFDPEWADIVLNSNGNLDWLFAEIDAKIFPLIEEVYEITL